ncbi:MAG: SGNH/GDSL hydrolase family protein [Clostridia bacterium]|nr:SGNH/GDSL hydrolase family protein [Clostridia bacterium]
MKKTICLCTCILLLTGVLLLFAQALLMPKYMSTSREGALIGEYYANASNNDVIFIGDCEVYESFTPPTLWEEYGITSYIRGSAQQLIWQSYYLLEETFTYESPKVVVFNVLSVKYGEPQNEAYNRMTLDGMCWSSSKINAIQASMTEDEDFLSYVFPLLRYHSRWSEIAAEDFRYLLSRDIVSHNGYLMQTGVKPMTETSKGFALADYTLPAVCMEYLEKMRVLCKENGAELVLIKAPTNNWKYYWYDEWDVQIADYATTHDVDYYNFIPLAEEIGIDWSTDTYDAGVHLNVYGAEKLTSYFGQILSANYGLEDRRTDAELCRIWDEKLVAYQKQRNGETS